MILSILTFVDLMFDRYWSVGLADEGGTLLYSIIEHCFAKKKKLKISAFLLKSVTNMLSWIMRNFLSFNSF